MMGPPPVALEKPKTSLCDSPIRRRIPPKMQRFRHDIYMKLREKNSIQEFVSSQGEICSVCDRKFSRQDFEGVTDSVLSLLCTPDWKNIVFEVVCKHVDSSYVYDYLSSTLPGDIRSYLQLFHLCPICLVPISQLVNMDQSLKDILSKIQTLSDSVSSLINIPEDFSVFQFEDSNVSLGVFGSKMLSRLGIVVTIPVGDVEESQGGKQISDSTTTTEDKVDTTVSTTVVVGESNHKGEEIDSDESRDFAFIETVSSLSTQSFDKRTSDLDHVDEGQNTRWECNQTEEDDRNESPSPSFSPLSVVEKPLGSDECVSCDWECVQTRKTPEISHRRSVYPKCLPVNEREGYDILNTNGSYEYIRVDIERMSKLLLRCLDTIQKRKKMKINSLRNDQSTEYPADATCSQETLKSSLMAVRWFENAVNSCCDSNLATTPRQQTNLDSSNVRSEIRVPGLTSWNWMPKPSTRAENSEITKRKRGRPPKNRNPTNIPCENHTSYFNTSALSSLESVKPKKPRGRPRKHPIPLENHDSSQLLSQPGSSPLNTKDDQTEPNADADTARTLEEPSTCVSQNKSIVALKNNSTNISSIENLVTETLAASPSCNSLCENGKLLTQADATSTKYFEAKPDIKLNTIRDRNGMRTQPLKSPSVSRFKSTSKNALNKRKYKKRSDFWSTKFGKSKFAKKSKSLLKVTMQSSDHNLPLNSSPSMQNFCGSVHHKSRVKTVSGRVPSKLRNGRSSFKKKDRKIKGQITRDSKKARGIKLSPDAILNAARSIRLPLPDLQRQDYDYVNEECDYNDMPVLDIFK